MARRADLSPFRLEAVRLGDRALRLVQPREVPVRVEDDLLLAEVDDLQLLSYGASRDELHESLRDDLFTLWDEYACAPDPELTTDGQALKRAVQAFLREND